MLRRALDLPLIVILSGMGAALMLVPAMHAASMRDYAVARTFLYSSVVLMALVALVGIAVSNWRPRNVARSHLVMLTGAYAVLPLLLAVPFSEALPDTTFANAWFEMVSAFTTTGATVYEAGRLAPSLHLWRALVGWSGGFFILVAAVSILAPLNLGGAEVISGRVPGRGASGAGQITRIADPAERLIRHTITLFPVYGGLTLALWIVLLLAGDPGLVALCHAMSTLSTSGITPLQGLPGAGSGIVGEVAIAAALCLALTRRGYGLAVGTGRDMPLMRDPELRMALVLVALATVLLFLRRWIAENPLADAAAAVSALNALWGTAFTALSFLTTTGFESHAWAEARNWSGPNAPGLLLMGLCIFGGGIATTAGGVKLLRVYALYCHGKHELERLVHPSSMGNAGAGQRHLRGEGAYQAWIFFMLFAISIGVATSLLVLAGLAFDAALVLSIAALTTTGPLANLALENPLAIAAIPGAAKAILGVVMVVGRLETLAVLALLSPEVWRR